LPHSKFVTDSAELRLTHQEQKPNIRCWQTNHAQLGRHG